MSEAFGQRLRVAIAHSGVSRAAVSTKCGVSPQAVHKWTQGTCYPASAHLLTICEMTGASMEWLMWPRPVDIRSTDYAPDGVHIKTLIREVMAEMSGGGGA